MQALAAGPTLHPLLSGLKPGAKVDPLDADALLFTATATGLGRGPHFITGVAGRFEARAVRDWLLVLGPEARAEDALAPPRVSWKGGGAVVAPGLVVLAEDPDYAQVLAAPGDGGVRAGPLAAALTAARSASAAFVVVRVDGDVRDELASLDPALAAATALVVRLDAGDGRLALTAELLLASAADAQRVAQLLEARRLGATGEAARVLAWFGARADGATVVFAGLLDEAQGAELATFILGADL
ncbi:MAG: hypothetical protein U1F43_11155 [Myxococcota bacterium]